MAGVFLCIYTCRQYTLRQREVFNVKLVLNRNEVLELKKLASTMGNICGDDVSRVMEMVDKQITTKKFIMSMVTGQFTFEVKEEFIVGLLNITNELVAVDEIVFSSYSDAETIFYRIMEGFKKYNNSVDKSQHKVVIINTYSFIKVH